MDTAMIAKITAAAAGAGAVLLCRSQYEREQLVTDTYEIRSEKIRGNGMTFVFLSDLHNREFGKKNAGLLKAVRAAGPDAVLIGGDMMVAKGKSDCTVPLELIRELAKEFPVYCGNGNHECRMEQQTEVYGNAYSDYREALEAAGVKYLSDASEKFGDDFILYGLDLPREAYRPFGGKMDSGYLTEKLGEPDKERFSILLAHSPMFFKEYAGWGADLSLAGHFHGGTIRLPRLGGVMTPQYQFFYPYCAGEFSAGDKRMIVSRGLGTHSINIRLNNKPQVVVVRIR